MRGFRADLHVHSCLSPCAELEMSPRAIVDASLRRGLDLIALCDHNSAENAGAVLRAGAAAGLNVLPGLEINSVEEIHVLAVFDTEEQALAMQELVYGVLSGSNRPEIFGDQVVANEFDEVEGFNDRLLIGAAGMSVGEVARQIHRLGGLSIASHVDRPSYSLLGQLGYVPEELDLDALELSPRTDPEAFQRDFPDIGLRGLPLVASSDAHTLRDLGIAWTYFEIEAAEVGELRRAFRGAGGGDLKFGEERVRQGPSCADRGADNRG